jgi:hypothetical protein
VDGADIAYEMKSANAGSFTLSDVPPNTSVTVYLKGYNQSSGKYSASTETKSLLTPGATELAPIALENLELTQSHYVTSDGIVHYEIKAAWLQTGVSNGYDIQWQQHHINSVEDWQGTTIPAASPQYTITNLEPGLYTVRVRSRSILFNAVSDWLSGDITVQVKDMPPGPPTSLEIRSTNSGVELLWTNPLDPDLAYIEIWESTYNNRGSATKIASILANQFFRPITDTAFRYYWVRAADTSGNLSVWAPSDALNGLEGRALGLIGDGQPPPPPTSLTLKADTWQVRLDWVNPEIKDLVGTEIWFSKTNDLGTATKAVLTKENFYTHLNLDADTTYYYWIRNYDVEDYYSTWFPIEPHSGQSVYIAKDPSDYIDLLGDLVFLVVAHPGKYVDTTTGAIIGDTAAGNPNAVWYPEGVYIRNALIKDGSLEGVKIKATSITSDKIDTRGLDIRDSAGNVIFSAGTGLDISRIANAGAFASLNKIQSSNIDIYIESGAIGNAYIGDYIQSADYLAGQAGWKINKQGNIEVYNLNARGSVQSNIFIPGQEGWRIDESGTVEFNSGVFRGQLSASSLIIGSNNTASPFTLADVIDGTAINRLDLQQSALFFSFNQLGDVQGTTSITFTAIGNNATAAEWECIPYGANGQAGSPITLAGEGNTRVLTAAQFANADYADVRVWFGGAEDRTRIGRVTDGGTGLTGYLSNEVQPLPVDGNGDITSYSMAVGSFNVFFGTQDVRSQCVFSVTLTSNIPAGSALIQADGTYAVTGISADVATVTFRATYSANLYIEKSFKVYKAAQSAPGPAGVVIDLSQDSHTVPTDSTGANGDYSFATTTANIYEGGTNTSSLWTWIEPTTANLGLSGGVTGVWNAGTRTFSVTGMTQDSGAVVFKATRAGYSNQSATFNISKSKGGEAYYLVVESTNGTTFRPGQGKTTRLQARLFNNGAEITNQTPASWFKWTRVSADPKPPPNDDPTWNSAYAAGYKQIDISVDDVHAKATFFCSVISP